MNVVRLLLDQDLSPRQLAFCEIGSPPVDFAGLMGRARRAQTALRSCGFSEGDSILLADSIHAEFYAVVIAALALGGRVILVEPFLPIAEIDSVISRTRPLIFVASWPGRIWGSRVASIRKIPYWKSARSLCAESGADGTLSVVDVAPETHGIVTFTTGTSTGRPKGVVRTHQGLLAQNRAIRGAASLEGLRGPDLAIFANLTLANLGMGRGTLFIPPGWKRRHLRALLDLPEGMKPESLSCGPAFLERILNEGALPETLRSIHVGGALTECALLEKAFSALPAARFVHVYGSSEAEPVAFVDAQKSVRRSKEEGFSQALLVGHVIPGLQSRMDETTMWVSGDHVCGKYLDNEEENRTSKACDEAGRVWHAMGDRMKESADGLWYQGRSFQNPEDFKLEQRIYPFLGHTRAFIFRDTLGRAVLSGEGVGTKARALKENFPELSRIQEKKIIRDRRHRARIDRGASQ